MNAPPPPPSEAARWTATGWNWFAEASGVLERVGRRATKPSPSHVFQPGTLCLDRELTRRVDGRLCPVVAPLVGWPMRRIERRAGARHKEALMVQSPSTQLPAAARYTAALTSRLPAGGFSRLRAVPSAGKPDLPLRRAARVLGRPHRDRLEGLRRFHPTRAAVPALGRRWSNGSRRCADHRSGAMARPTWCAWTRWSPGRRSPSPSHGSRIGTANAADVLGVPSSGGAESGVTPTRRVVRSLSTSQTCL